MDRKTWLAIMVSVFETGLPAIAHTPPGATIASRPTGCPVSD